MTDSTIEFRIAARIARVSGARDAVIRTLIDDLKTSIRGAELGGELANPLERRALEVLGKLRGADVDRLRITVADLYRLHLRRGPAWDHDPTREVMEAAADLIATFPTPPDDPDLAAAVEAHRLGPVPTDLLDREDIRTLVDPSPSGFDPSFASIQIGGQIAAAVDLGMTPAEARLLVDAPEAPVTLDDPRFAAHPVAQANAASWPSPKRRRKLTRAEKIAASKAAEGSAP